MSARAETAPAQADIWRLGAHIQRGDMAPWWDQGAHKFLFDPFPSRYIMLGFGADLGDTAEPAELAAAGGFERFLDTDHIAAFWVSSAPLAWPGRAAEAGRIRTVHDADGAMRRAYGVGPSGIWIVLDPMLRVVEVVPFGSPGAAARQVAALIERLPPPSLPLGFEALAPALILPDVFEPAFCDHLIGCYERAGGRQSGFMQEVRGLAVEQHDAAWKRRRDHLIAEPALVDHIKTRIGRRVGLMMRRTFQFKLSRMERHLVACYAAEDGGHFGPHRDDTVRATEHRRFAVSINLSDDFDGGELSFPEYGARAYKAPVGAAVIFSCAMLHQVSRVTRGRRYAFLPFLHDEEAEQARLANLQFLARPA